LAFAFGLGRRRHPGQRVDPAGERGHLVLDHRLGAGFFRRREVAGDVELADGLAERAAGGVDRALPALALGRRAAQHLSVEREVLVVERLGQHVGVALGGVKRQVVLPGLERLELDELGDADQRGGLPDHEVGLAIEPGGGQ
jgi:hypothetical protein